MTSTLVPETDSEGKADPLERTWSSPGGFLGWFTHVNHKSIGRRFIITSFIFLLLGGVEALLMRSQLAVPGAGILDQEAYRQFFTMHGITMMFFFAVPIMEGIGIYFIPLMIGTRDMAFPRLNAFGYYVYLIAGVVLYASFFLGLAPHGGWFNYPPLANREFSPGINIDIYATMITFIEISALVAAVELIVTIFKLRAPGMSLHRMPVFVWSILVMSFMIVFAMPPLMVSSVMMAVDRTVGGHFFNPDMMGDVVLWQHIFWFFGHPEVYIIFVPALGFVSMIVATFCRRPLFGQTAVIVALVATGFISFGLWVHHMFATGLPRLGLSFFTAASMLIAIPTGVQFFCWIATFWGSRPVFRTPFLFILGFFFVFLIGGITGVQLGSVPFNTQVHDTFFVVAHMHYVLIGGALFPLFGAFYYWFPKIGGRMLSERLGRWNVGLMFVGMNVTFWPQHHLGLMGMPRRIWTYGEGMGWAGLNLLSTIGAFILAAGVMVFIVNVFWSLRNGAPAGANPWGADTLEWATDSPPPAYNFQHLPTVSGPHPLWEDGWADRPKVVGLRPTHREVLVTDLMDAEPQSRMILPGPTYIPFLAAAAVATGFIGVMFVKLIFVFALLLTYLALVAWNWPRMAHQLESEDGREHRLARGQGDGGMNRELEGEGQPGSGDRPWPTQGPGGGA